MSEILQSFGVWLPLALLVFSIPSAVAIYAFQKRLDRKNDLIDIKRQNYQDYLCTLADQFGYREKLNHEAVETAKFELIRRRMNILCVGSDEVIRKVRAFAILQEDKLTEERLEEILQSLAELVLAMRQDCFSKTKITQDELRQLLPFTISTARQSK